jgi:hypothetical protein
MFGKKKDDTVYKGEHIIVERDKEGWLHIQILPNLLDLSIPDDIAEEVAEDLRNLGKVI